MRLAEYIAARSVQVDCGCIESGPDPMTKGGYGTANHGGLKTTAHRAAYIARHGCKNGHEFNEANTYVKANGCKSCRICNADRQRALRQKFPERYRFYDKARSHRK